MYGWHYLELSKGGNVMDLVGRYVKLDRLASGQIISQFESGVQDRMVHTDSSLPGRKRRRRLSGESCLRSWERPMMLTTTPRDDLEIGSGYLRNNIATFDTDGSDPEEDNGKGDEAWSPHVTLLPDWPPRWAPLNVPDGGLDYDSEAQEQTNLCSHLEPGGPASDIDSSIEADMNEEVRESQQGGQANGTIVVGNSDSSSRYHLPTQLRQNSEAPSRFVDDILMMDPETAASINMFNISI